MTANRSAAFLARLFFVTSALAATGAGAQDIKPLVGHSETAYDVAISPNADLVASASFDGKIILWKVSDGSNVATLSDHTGKVLTLAFSPDGKRLASGGDD